MTLMFKVSAETILSDPPPSENLDSKTRGVNQKSRFGPTRLWVVLPLEIPFFARLRREILHFTLSNNRKAGFLLILSLKFLRRRRDLQKTTGGGVNQKEKSSTKRTKLSRKCLKTSGTSKSDPCGHGSLKNQWLSQLFLRSQLYFTHTSLEKYLVSFVALGSHESSAGQFGKCLRVAFQDPGGSPRSPMSGVNFQSQCESFYRIIRKSQVCEGITHPHTLHSSPHDTYSGAFASFIGNWLIPLSMGVGGSF